MIETNNSLETQIQKNDGVLVVLVSSFAHLDKPATMTEQLANSAERHSVVKAE